MRKCFGALAMAVIVSPSAFAQSSVTLFGLLDAGVSYVSNEGGGKNVKFDDGIFTPNLFGFAGSEDIGGGTRVVFKLVNQFALGNGAMIGGGIFARSAYVGLENDRYGKLSLGNQYDFMVDSLFFGNNEIAEDLTGLYGFRNGPFQKLAIPNNPTGAFDWDRVAGSTRVANSVKYVSPNISGLSFGALYGFGNVPGSVGANNTVSFGANYEIGTFGAGAAYTNVKYGATAGVASTSIRNWGIGAHYTFGQVTAKALLTTVRNSANDTAAWMIETGSSWQFAPQWAFGASYTYMKGNAELSNNHAHQISSALQYILSKRTLVYAAAVYQKASSGGQAQISGVLDPDGAASGTSQAIVRVGIHTTF
jgi:predicted porin